MRRLRLIVMPFLVLLGGCSGQSDTWTAFVYPPGRSLAAEDASKAIYGHYESFKQCQSASMGALRQLASENQSEDFGSYECGVGCRYKQEGVGHLHLQGDPEVRLVQWEDFLDRMEHVHPCNPSAIAEVADQSTLAIATL